MRIDVLSLFPDFIAQCAGVGVVGRAAERGLISVQGWNPRDYATDNYRRVDERPFGGGPGMVMLMEPLGACLDAALAADPAPARVIYTSPQGVPLTQAKARELAALPRLVVVCGRYEGVDERVRDFVDEELSIGDYVLSGGELPALVVLDAVVRLLPGVLGNEASPIDDSFATGLLEGPQYTRPAAFRDARVPDVLLSGDHGAIARWRREQALRTTLARRPDLLDRAPLDGADVRFLRTLGWTGRGNG